MSENQAVTVKDKVENVRTLLDKYKGQMQLALPKHMSVDRLMRVALTQCVTTPKLLECTPQSLIAALMTTAQLGLEPGVLGQAYLVPFKNNRNGGRYEVQLIPGYKGYIKLAHNSGEVAMIKANVVYKGDEYIYSDGIDPVLKHTPNPECNFEDDGIIAAYAIAKMKDGANCWVWLWRKQIEKFRKKSKASNDGPWVTDYAAMCMKTAVRRLATFMPLSADRWVAAHTLDERSEMGIPQDLNLTGDIIDIAAGGSAEEDENHDGSGGTASATPSNGGGSKLDQLANNLQNKPAEPQEEKAPAPAAEKTEAKADPTKDWVDGNDPGEQKADFNLVLRAAKDKKVPEKHVYDFIKSTLGYGVVTNLKVKDVGKVNDFIASYQQEAEHAGKK